MGSGFRWRGARAPSWTMFAAAAVLAVVAVLVDRWEGPSVVIVALALAGALGGVVLAQWKDAAKTRDARQISLDSSIRTITDKSLRAPTVSQTSLQQLGVHKALTPVRYLRRDAEDEVVVALETSAQVLILGNSMSGKTRLAAEVALERYADWPVVIPDVPTGLADLMNAGATPRQSVVWLDDLERYIDDPKNLKSRWLEALVSGGNVILATMRETAYERFRPSGDLPSTQWQLLAEFVLVRLVDDEEERRRLAIESGDATAGEGIFRYGLGAYLGGGPLAVDAFQSARNAHPLAYALIRAAVDWRRSGIGEYIPQTTARSLVEAYLNRKELAENREELSDAIQWATSWKTGRDALRLLAPNEEGWRVFDYVLDYVSSERLPIPDGTWDAIVLADAPASNLTAAARTAFILMRTPQAETLFARAASLGDPDAMVGLGIILDDRQEVTEAERLFREAAALGGVYTTSVLGMFLRRYGASAEAEELLREAADSGEPYAMNQLAILLREKGESQEAERLWRDAAALGVADATFNLGVSLHERGETEAGELLLRDAVAQGNADAMTYVAVLLDRRGEPANAEALWRDAVALGQTKAMIHLAMFLSRRGTTDEPLHLLRDAVASGDADAEPILQMMLGQRREMEGYRFYALGELEEAERAWREGGALGNVDAMNYLAVLLDQRGDAEEALQLWREAAAGGSSDASIHLRERGEPGQV